MFGDPKERGPALVRQAEITVRARWTKHLRPAQWVLGSELVDGNGRPPPGAEERGGPIQDRPRVSLLAAGQGRVPGSEGPGRVVLPHPSMEIEVDRHVGLVPRHRAVKFLAEQFRSPVVGGKVLVGVDSKPLHAGEAKAANRRLATGRRWQGGGHLRRQDHQRDVGARGDPQRRRVRLRLLQGAVRNLTRTLALELAPLRINVNNNWRRAWSSPLSTRRRSTTRRCSTSRCRASRPMGPWVRAGHEPGEEELHRAA